MRYPLYCTNTPRSIKIRVPEVFCIHFFYFNTLTCKVKTSILFLKEKIKVWTISTEIVERLFALNLQKLFLRFRLHLIKYSTGLKSSNKVFQIKKLFPILK